MKSYPKTKFEIINNTSIDTITTNDVTGTIPLMMATYTSEKGSEDWELLRGNLTDFTTRKGGLSFTKHGQPQLLVANILTNGGYILAKRMVSEDAKLANVTIKARIVQVDSVSYVYFYTSSDTNVKTFEDACESGYGNFDPEAELHTESVTTEHTDGAKDKTELDVPLFTITPMGRGASNLSIRLNPEYYASKSSAYMKYTFEVSQNTEILDSIICTVNPDAIIDSINYSIQSKIDSASTQVKIKVYEDGLLAMTKLVAKTASKQVETITFSPEGVKQVQTSTVKIGIAELINLDFFNARDKKENPIAGIITKGIAEDDTISDETNQRTLWTELKPADIEKVYGLDDVSGIPLVNGTNGKMGDTPIKNEAEYEKMLLASYGQNKASILYDPVIYDLDRYKIDAIFDCAYPMTVKNAIVNLVDFRGDCVFLADLGKKYKTLDEITDAADNIIRSKFVAIYHNFFDIIDPYTKKQITVTMPYLLSTKLINHIDTGVGKAFAGIANGLQFPEIINNTINFTPVIVPGLDQKQILADHCINYLSLYDDIPVMDSMWVCDDAYTQLSYLHNVLSIQEIIKIIRTRCPKTRYTFLDGDDLDAYLEDTNTIIKQYKNNFKSVSMIYMSDGRFENNNIFYATIKVTFHNFVNEEYFKVIAID